jgi:anti-sigma regulatory factor (Ser/Thr protein kinase)
MKQTIQIRVEQDVASAVTVAANIATNLGFDQARVSAISTAVSEIARNIVKYADFGQVTIRAVHDPQPGIEITARDRGPGITDVESALQDHFSTSGTLGLGLPGVRRLMDELTVESTPGSGTTVRMRMLLRDGTQRPPRGQRTATAPAGSINRQRAGPGRKASLQPHADRGAAQVLAGSFVRAHQAETVSGDLVVLRWIGPRALIVVLDALGHGRAAGRIAASAAEAVAKITQADVLGTIDTIDEALRGSDGAAAAVTIANPGDRSIDITSVGNVRVRVLGPAGLRIPWTEGTLGQRFRRPVVQHRLLGQDTLVMYSDGVSDHFADNEYPAAMVDPPDLAAQTIVQQFGKDYDDSACAVVRFAR